MLIVFVLETSVVSSDVVSVPMGSLLKRSSQDAMQSIKTAARQSRNTSLSVLFIFFLLSFLFLKICLCTTLVFKMYSAICKAFTKKSWRSLAAPPLCLFCYFFSIIITGRSAGYCAGSVPSIFTPKIAAMVLGICTFSTVFPLKTSA